jgi:uncharacterized RDD family membrane protein YckC
MTCRNHFDVSDGIRNCFRCQGEFCRDCLVDIGGLPYCAACKSEQLLDVRSGVDPTVMNYASIGRRFAAILIDAIVMWIPTGILIALVGFATMMRARINGEWNFWILLPMAIGITYQAVMLATRGQTFGKMALSVRVVRTDGTPITPAQAWGREVLRAVLNFLYVIDYIPAFFTKERTCIHDLAARTRVIQW